MPGALISSLRLSSTPSITSPLHEATRLFVTLPHVISPSSELQGWLTQKQISLESGDADAVTLGFDEERKGQQISFHPDIPLIIRW
ncbi:MAG: hypothetical protein AAFU71_03610 [Cyanobacteria bacterium J06632_22]